MNWTKKQITIGSTLIMLVMLLELIIPTISIGNDLIEITFPDEALYNAIVNSTTFKGKFYSDKESKTIRMSQEMIDSIKGFAGGGDEDEKIQDLSGLEVFKNIVSLSLPGNQIANIELLSEFKNLTSLNLNNNRIGNIGSLEGLTNLTYLYLESNNISNISALAGLTNLKILYLGNFDYEEIQAMNLNYSDFCNNNITEVSSLENLTNLEMLDIHNNGVEDLRGIEGLTNLKNLYLKENIIQDIRPLSELKNLSTLSLSSNCISYTEPLKNLTNLYYLDLANNNINYIEPLAELKNLTRLNLSENDITSISELSQLTKIHTLYLNNNEIDTLNALSNFSNLVQLDASNNMIMTTDGLSNKPKMTTLNLSRNIIYDISDLSKSYKLKSLDLSNNNITDISELKEFVYLTELHLDGNFISDISGLTELINEKERGHYKAIETFSINANQIYMLCKVGGKIPLPPIYVESLKESSIFYGGPDFETENCEIDNDNNVIVKAFPAYVKIVAGTAEETCLTINEDLGFGGEPEKETPEEYEKEESEGPPNENEKDKEGKENKDSKFNTEEGEKEENIDETPTKEENPKFVIGRDNNSFSHNNAEWDSESGFLGVKNYIIPEEYFKVLTKGVTYGEECNILSEEYKRWKGSCYGIASMMGLVYYNKIDLNSIQKGEANFFNLDKPYKEKKLLNMIQTYQLSQNIGEHSGLTKYYEKWTSESESQSEEESIKFKEFLEEFINTIKNEIVEFSYAYKVEDMNIYGERENKIIAHAILACEYLGIEPETGWHYISLYDMNSVGSVSDRGGFTSLRISPDFGDFEMITPNDPNVETSVNEVTFDNLEWLGFKKFDDYNIFDLKGIKASESKETKEVENKLTLGFDANSKFTIENSKNETLSYDKGEVSGEIEVQDMNPIVYGDDTALMQITIPYDEKITYKENAENTGISIHDNNNFVSLEGENVKLATIDLGNSVEIEGENSQIKAQIDNGKEGLYELNTKINGDITLTKEDENIVITSEQEMKDVEINELNPEEKKTLAKEINSENITIDNEGRIKVNDKNVKEIKISQTPEKLRYIYQKEELDVTGGEIEVTYDDESKGKITITNEMVTGFDNSKIGTNTITVEYEGKTATFDVEIKQESITSDAYTIDNTEKIISNIDLKTTVSAFKEKIESTSDYQVKDKNGNNLSNEDYIRTECKIITSLGEYTLIVKGDLNGTGDIELNDLAQAQKINLELMQETKNKLLAGDLNQNGKIDLNDLAKLQKIFLEKD